MKISALKNSIFENIAQIEDASFLKAINTIIENKLDKSIYKLNAKQRAEIEQSQNEIAKGNFIANEDVDEEVKQWLKEK